MKSMLLISLLMIVSCGKIEQIAGENEIGFEKEVNFIKVTPTDVAAIKQICQALEDRVPFIGGLNGTDYMFEYATKGCADASVPTGVDTEVTLSQTTTEFKFLLKNTNTFFYFQDVESNTDGAMAELCARQNNLTTSPIELSNNNYLFFNATSIPQTNCPFVVDEQCINIERGILYGKPTDIPKKATIISRDFIRYRLNTALSRKGFWTYKRNVVPGDCEDQKSIVRQANLK